ncbi:MAG TPA: phosphoglycerate kinase [Solirubrobacteraceae bacterium]|nr:phosphoglycerate kinase [Solirubrobacteraceae bacterium]
MKTLDDVDLAGDRVFLRCELNVAMSDHGVADYTRIEASRPTFDTLRNTGCRIVICSHMGRPWGKHDPSKSLRQLIEPLNSVLETDVRFVDDCVGAARDEAVAALREGEVLLLENVRYHSEENSNDTKFGEALVQGMDVYVNDAFGNCHRPHASMVAAALAAPERCAGRLLERELAELQLLHNPDFRPTLAVIGGAKVSGKDGKLFVVKNLLKSVDRVAVIGKLAYYFLLARGVEVGVTLSADTRGIDAPGASLTDDIQACQSVLAEAEELGKPLLLPTDSVVNCGDSDALVDFETETVPATGRALDIGPGTLKSLRRAIGSSNLVVWNGPAGYFEEPAYQAGTLGIAKALGQFSGHAVIGGGDTVAAVASALGNDHPSIHICTGGGAMLTWLMGAELPGIAALEAVPSANH